MTIGAGEQTEVSYTVKVGSNVPDGKIVSGSAKVGGVTVKASTLFVANTLTSAQQQTLLDTFGDANRRLERIYGYVYYYVVLRPSRVLDI